MGVWRWTRAVPLSGGSRASGVSKSRFPSGMTDRKANADPSASLRMTNLFAGGRDVRGSHPCRDETAIRMGTHISFNDNLVVVVDAFDAEEAGSLAQLFLDAQKLVVL